MPLARVTCVLLGDGQALVTQDLTPLLEESFELVGVVHDGRGLVNARETLRPPEIVTAVSHKCEIIPALGMPTTAESIQYAMRMKLIAE
jgi:hypothetical protein